MKMYKLEVYFIDFDDRGADHVTEIIENNRHYSLSVEDIEEADIGEWTDEHVLNIPSCNMVEKFRAYFNKP
jgi:hypothetical protein